jgi:transposase InsO family protein
VEQRLDMVLAPERYGFTVTETCDMWDVSRTTFYEWKKRFERDGLSGLEDRSSRPVRSPGRISGQMESRIVEMRTAHPRWGARRIRSELRRARAADVPARSTIERVLIRNGLIGAPTPAAPPLCRFVRERPNELWQMDAKEWMLVDRTVVQIISALDDHSRYCGASEAVAQLSSQAAIAVFEEAVAELGLPETVLADRGSIFTGKRTTSVVAFERHLWAYGVCTINCRPRHPQTQGKIERFHRTLTEWLEDNGPYDSLEALNSSLNAFRHDYNHQRPNQALPGDCTPAEIWAATAPAGPDPELAAQHCRREALRPTGTTGNLTYAAWIIGLGREWARTKVRVIDLGHTIEIRDVNDDLIRDIKPDYAKRYLGTGTPRGRRRRQIL